MKRYIRRTDWLVAVLVHLASSCALAEPLLIATFQADATPPLGSPLCNGSVPAAMRIVDPLSVRGVVLLADKSIVLCAVDWAGIGNDGHKAWRKALAEAAGTTSDRVAVQTVHQHDAPGCDLSVEGLLSSTELAGRMCDVAFAHAAIERTARAMRESLKHPRPVTHLGLGLAKVERVASTRRVLGPDGRVKHVRLSWCRDPEAIDAPEGLIDPYVRLISFWNGDRPVASLTYYACHPQSFYGRGAVSADFAGLARGLREATVPEALHIHFDGCGGNVAAGKYNDGSPGRRFELAGRLADGMARAWDAIEKRPITKADVRWVARPVSLPLRDGWNEDHSLSVLHDADVKPDLRVRAARDIVWIRRCTHGDVISLSCLRIGNAFVVHLPGEPFVEYQLAAQRMRTDGFVCVAGYGDFGPGYIPTAIAYDQGGYETGTTPAVSRVGPGVEALLLSAMSELLR